MPCFQRANLQQLKTQLNKAHAEAKQQNKIPPTKIILSLPDDIQAQLILPDEIQAQLKKYQNKMAIPSQPLPIQPLAPSPVLTTPAPTNSPVQNINSILTQEPFAPQVSAWRFGSQRTIVQQQILQSSLGVGNLFMGTGPVEEHMATVDSLTSQAMTTPIYNVTHMLHNTSHPMNMVLSSHQNATSNAHKDASTTTMLSTSLGPNANDNSDKFETMIYSSPDISYQPNQVELLVKKENRI